jgi:hypothetical protein
MILDKQLMFSLAQDLGAASDETVVSTNVIDLGAKHAKVPSHYEDGDLEIAVGIPEDFAGGTSVQFILYTDADVAFGSPLVVFESKVFPIAQLKGDQLPLRIPSIPAGLERYLRMSYVVVGTMTAGMVDCGLVIDKQSNVR